MLECIMAEERWGQAVYYHEASRGRRQQMEIGISIGR